MTDSDLPIVGIICDYEKIGPHPIHSAGNKYVKAVVEAANCLPILLPTALNKTHLEQLLGNLDGVLLPGGYSMVDPLNYQTTPAVQGTKLDKARDNISFSMIKLAIELGIPLFGICRGFQEMNVALGGSLHQKLHQVGQFQEHREDKELVLEQQYAPSHDVAISVNGELNKIIGSTTIQVNSLHTQGVEQLSSKLFVEATSDDGLCEAFSVKNSLAFAIGVQWHPEWQVMDNNNNNNRKLFEAFGNACKARQAERVT